MHVHRLKGDVRIVRMPEARLDLQPVIMRYSEVFDRGMVPAQVGFVPERLQKIGLRYAEEPKRAPSVRLHLADS